MTKAQDLIINEKRALEILGVKLSTLRRLAKSWALDVIQYDHGRTRMYYQAQILTLKDDHKAGFMNGYAILDKINILAAQQNTLARQLRLMAEVLGLHHIAYSPSDAVLSGVYEVAMAKAGSFKEKRPTTLFLNQWLSVVPLLTAREYRRLSGIYKSDEQPWCIFYKMTEELLTAVGVHYNLEVSRDMERYRTRLELCLDRIVDAARVFIAIEDPKANLARRVADVLGNAATSEEKTGRKESDLHDMPMETMDPDQAVNEMWEEAHADGIRGMSRSLLDLPGLADQPRSRPRSGG